MVGIPLRWRRPNSPYSGKVCFKAQITAERLASVPPLVKVAREVLGNPNFAASQPRVWRSISLPAGEVRQLANWELYIATSVSATTEASVTLGLKRPK